MVDLSMKVRLITFIWVLLQFLTAETPGDAVRRVFPYTYPLPKKLPAAIDAQVSSLIRRTEFKVHCGRTPIDLFSIQRLQHPRPTIRQPRFDMLNDDLVNGYLFLIEQCLPVDTRIRFCGTYFFAKLREDKKIIRPYSSEKSTTKKYLPKGVRFL